MSSNIEELLAISPLLTAEYLSAQLSQWFGRDLQYGGHEFGEETGKGDSYLSDVYRIRFIANPTFGKGCSVFLKVILKAFPKNIARRKTFRSHTFFRNEINFYEIILPKFLEFQATKNMTSPFDCCPKVFASATDGKNDFLALEDLTEFGFGGAVRQEGIDYPHCCIILESFAKFHALSFAYKNSYPEEYEKLAEAVPEVYYSEEYWDWYGGFWKTLCPIAIDAVEKEYPNTKYVQKIKDFATDEAFKKLAAATKIQGPSAVIGHGDSWTPNFLLKYKPGTKEPIDAKMIDFQLARSGSPILDISFFIYACSSQELREKHYDDMLKHYHKILSIQIREMGCDPDKLYSWETFMDEVKKYSFFGLGFSLESTPVTILEPDEAFDMDSITGTETMKIEEIWILKPIRSKAGRQRLAGNIVHAVDKGYI